VSGKGKRRAVDAATGDRSAVTSLPPAGAAGPGPAEPPVPDAGLEQPPVAAKPARAPRLDPLAVRRQLRGEGLRAQHSMSQNFLADPDVLQAILDLAAPEPGDRILEVGPGLGILTGGLLDGGAEVTAVELDRRLADRLTRVHEGPIAAGALHLVQGDILDQNISTLIASPFEVVANVPYHITSPILHRLLGTAPRPRRLILMVQKEVAERISAAPGSMSYLSIFVQYHATVRIAFEVPRDAFEPAPEVGSAVVVIEPRDPMGERPRLSPTDEDDLWRVVQAGFRERRKMLHNVLSRQLPFSGAEVGRALAACGIEGERRPQTLAVDDWLAIRGALGPLPPMGAAASDARGPEAAGGEPRSARTPGSSADRGTRPGRGAGRPSRGTGPAKPAGAGE
jgi:16S rRNA (adenine1518-N6/adenine1519-N6)-dimethyltransferase